MSEEILTLHYDAASTLVRMTIPAIRDGVDPQGNPIKVRVLGAIEPKVTVPVAELIAAGIIDLEKAYAFAVAKNGVALADPAALQKQANDNAAALKQIADERAAHDAAVQKALEDKAAANAALAEINAQIEAKKVELLAVQPESPPS